MALLGHHSDIRNQALDIVSFNRLSFNFTVSIPERLEFTWTIVNNNTY